MRSSSITHRLSFAIIGPAKVLLIAHEHLLIAETNFRHENCATGHVISLVLFPPPFFGSIIYFQIEIIRLKKGVGLGGGLNQLYYSATEFKLSSG